jgi:four helix bundle protein
MATFKRFEEIEAWQLARKISHLVFNYSNRGEFARDYELRGQWRSSSGSIMDNTAEGFCRGHNNEFVYFLGIARGSCGEVQSQCYRALDRGYITQAELDEIYQLADQCSGKLANLSAYLKNSPLKGFRKK